MSGGMYSATLPSLFWAFNEAAELHSPKLRFSSRSSIGMLPRPLSTFLSPSPVDALWRQAGWRQSCRAVFGGVVRSSSSVAVASAACVFVSKASCVLEESRADDKPRISTYTAALPSICGFERWFFFFLFVCLKFCAFSFLPAIHLFHFPCGKKPARLMSIIWRVKFVKGLAAPCSLCDVLIGFQRAVFFLCGRRDVAKFAKKRGAEGGIFSCWSPASWVDKGPRKRGFCGEERAAKVFRKRLMVLLSWQLAFVSTNSGLEHSIFGLLRSRGVPVQDKCRFPDWDRPAPSYCMDFFSSHSR